MIHFVTGIDTDAGKTVATSLLLRFLRESGKDAAAMKLVQTGLSSDPGDSLSYRTLGGVAEGPDCPANFLYPSSPDLAASLEGKRVEPHQLIAAAESAAQKWHPLLVEGAGGLAVPLTETVTVMDMLEETGWSVILVTSARLGGINHTLLSLEALAGRGISLTGLVFNEYPVVDRCMRDHALMTYQRALSRYGFADRIATMPVLGDLAENGQHAGSFDCSVLFR